LRRQTLLILLIALKPWAVWADAADPVVAVVGRDAADLGSVLAALRLEHLLVQDVGGIPENADVALVLAEGYPRPTPLTDAQCRHLETIARQGVRVYVELAQPAGSNGLFDCDFGPEPARAVHERLVVLAPMGGLRPQDLLDEHDGAYVPFTRLPDGAQTLLEYDLALGTYRREPWPEHGVYAVTIDLGAEEILGKASQRYGAGQPNYYPESVELWLAGEGGDFRQVSRMSRRSMPETVSFDLDGQRARRVRFVARKLRRSPVTDFFFMGEVELLDQDGRNVALHAAYSLDTPHSQAIGYEDSGSRLTDGVVEGLYTDRLSVGWSTPQARAEGGFPAVVRVPWGRGAAILSAGRLSDFRQRNFRLTARWEELWRQMIIDLLPVADRPRVARRFVPLEAHTEPRVWAVPGTEVKLVVNTSERARVSAKCQGLGPIELIAAGKGRHEVTLSPGEGRWEFDVQARTQSGDAHTRVTLDCRSRKDKYRQVLDLNMRWFMRSGVMPKPDGTEGIHSQVCMAWLDGGFQNPLGSPFRTDCNAMSAEALYLYGKLTGEETYKRVACNIADTVVAHQFADVNKASLGGFPWLYENCDVIFFWDDNCRISNALLWLYHWTGEERYLASAALCAELFRQVARDDTCVHRHAIARPDLDRLGREAYRRYSQGTDCDYRLMHWWTLAAVTGDPVYEGLAKECTRLWSTQAGMRGCSHAAYYTGDGEIPGRLGRLAQGFLDSANVRKWGMTTVGGGGYEAAFKGDCNIATHAEEPLTDQIYSTPWLFRHALRAWKASGDERCKSMCELVGDYLARIQFRHSDTRLDGCWMRGFDLESWEYYGAPYDPQYGPYSAYTGWMNAIAAQAFAWYLLDEQPFIAPSATEEARQVVARCRKASPRLVAEGANVALGCPYRLGRNGSGPYADDGKKLTDGVVDGHYADLASVGWSIPAIGLWARVTMDLDLQQTRSIALITQQYGAGVGGYNPDEVRVLAGSDGETYELIGTARPGSKGAGLLWLRPDEPLRARHLRFELSKQRRSAITDFLFVGETKAYETP